LTSQSRDPCGLSHTVMLMEVLPEWITNARNLLSKSWGPHAEDPVQLGSRSIWGRIRMWFTRRREIKVSGWGLPATRMVNFRSYEISSTNRSRHRAPLAIRCT